MVFMKTHISTSPTSNLITLPSLVTSSIISYLDPASLALLAKTCTTMRIDVDNYLTTNRVVDMTVEPCRSMAWDRRREAFMFLTKNGSVKNLRKLAMDDELESLQLIKKVVKMNKKLEELSLTNIKIIRAIVTIIKNLPNLEVFKLSSDMCVAGYYRNELFEREELWENSCKCIKVSSKFHPYFELCWVCWDVLGNRCSLCHTNFDSFFRFVANYKQLHSVLVKCKSCEEDWLARS